MDYAKYECVLKKSAVHESERKYTCDKPDEVVNFLRNYTDLAQYPDEHVFVVFLDCKKKIVGYSDVSYGCRTHACCNPSSVFRNAILLNADGIILAHNHPSGDTTPSGPDMDLTKQIADAGEIIGISLIDHIILCDENYVSFLERGLMSKTEKH